ncbi:MAG: nuclear transport factor 2 family protein [Deltaproteobacteria bacterium]|nr:nuclear transport factor 2 family protein [Deltaproteobacteria bacterium]
MSTMDIANKYVGLCKEFRFDAALELFSNDAVSVEAGAPPGKSAEARGLDAIREKGREWGASHEVHSGKVEGPWPNGNRFLVRFTFDVTNKAMGQRMQMDEMGLFTVENGKIVREEFFYSMGG